MSKKPKASDEGPAAPAIDPANFVILESADGHRFLVDKNCAKVSRLIKQALGSIALGDPMHTNELQCSQSTWGRPSSSALDANSSSSTSATYTLVRLLAVDAAQLEEGIRFGHYKYRYDQESDKRPPCPMLAQGGKFAPVACLLQL